MPSTARKKLTILFTCIGRRVALAEAFRQAARRMKLPLTLIGAEVNPLAPALWVCDHHVTTKPIGHAKHIDQLVRAIRKHKVDLLIPTIDTELKALAENKPRFERAGAKVLISTPEVIEICQDKRKTRRFLVRHGFDTPATWTLRQLAREKPSFPLFLKPWDGSASKGNRVANNTRELQFYAKRIANCIAQQFIVGQEYTCDVYVDFHMQVRCVVPRKRIEVRAGEVSKGQTVKLADMMQQCKRLVETLGAGPGLITIQCFLTPDGKIKFIEINPRFGGGAPLSIQAGADFPKWILQEMLGKRPRIPFDAWQENLYMLRYDQAIWLSQSDLKF